MLRALLRGSGKSCCFQSFGTTPNCYEKQLYYLLSPDVSDIPVTENLLNCQRGCETVMPLHTYFANKEDLKSCANAGSESFHYSRTILQKVQSSKKKRHAPSTLNMESMHAVPSVLHKFLFVGLHSSVDLYSTSWPEPMHACFLGLSTIMKKCLFAMLPVSERTFSAIISSQKKVIRKK